MRVDTVSPGVIHTPTNSGTGDVLDALTAPTPGGRPGMQEDIAEAVLWLAGDQSGFVHGATLRVDGGIASTKG